MKTITQPELPAFSLTNFTPLDNDTNARATFDIKLPGVVLLGAALIRKQGDDQSETYWTATHSKVYSGQDGRKKYSPTARLDAVLANAITETAARLYRASRPEA